MPGIFTRKTIAEIMSNESLTPEERTDQVFSLYGRAIDDGYLTKGAAAAAQAAAIEQAKTDWQNAQTKPDIKGSDEYKALEGEFAAYKAMQAARVSDDYKGVKPKFFETVYGMVDRADGAKPVNEQLDAIRGQYEEYFIPTDDGGDNGGKNTPQYSQQPTRTNVNPTSEEDKLFKQLSDAWK
jgi:hypothetical protein